MGDDLALWIEVLSVSGWLPWEERASFLACARGLQLESSGGGCRRWNVGLPGGGGLPHRSAGLSLGYSALLRGLLTFQLIRLACAS